MEGWVLNKPTMINISPDKNSLKKTGDKNKSCERCVYTGEAASSDRIGMERFR